MNPRPANGRAGEWSIDASAFDAAAFDLDGVITKTADLHAAAWRELFDDFLKGCAKGPGEPFHPFDVERDYRLYVDGRPREDGVRRFLASRGITLPEGEPDDPPGQETVRSLASRKDQLFLKRLAAGVAVFGDSIPFLTQVRQAGLKTAIVSSSRNAAMVLEAAGLQGLFDLRVDGIEATRQGLKGKPAPDTFAYALKRLGVAPARAAGFEDAIVGVEAIRAAEYGLVVGVDRSGQAAELRQHGADIAVPDLGALKIVFGRIPPRIVEAAAGAPKAADLPVSPTDDRDWVLVEEGFNVTREHELESIFAIGNGHLGSRASLAELSVMSAPATFMAGLFDPEPGPTPGLSRLPNWTLLRIWVDGTQLRLDKGRTLMHRRILDMKQGILWREWRQEDAAGRMTRMRELRLASMDDRRLLLQSVSLTPENYSGTVGIEIALGDIAEHRISTGALAALAEADQFLAPGAEVVSSSPETSLKIEAELGSTYRLDRAVYVASSSDPGPPQARARAEAANAIKVGFPALISQHRDAWQARWAAGDIEIAGDAAVQRALRFAVYHLLSAADPRDERVSIGARALTGSAYKGHVFWDTEIFMLPFFVLTWPEAARAMLMYRYHTLPAARAKASQYGARGAFYAWESADTGQDVTPRFVIDPNGVVTPILVADQEQHISADIAYGVWNYWRATGDNAFLLDAGAEILFETARFWAARSEVSDDGLRHICGVIGPDEYHGTVDDNAYTNGMARWNLDTAANVARSLAGRWPERWRGLASALDLGDREIAQWETIAREIYTGYDPRTGLIEQFRGYFALEDIDLSAYEPRNAPMDVILGRERIMRSKVIKQADVLMLLHLLWDHFPQHVRAANFQYYAPRCGQGSSLSPAIHAVVAARLGELELAERYFRQAGEIDLRDNMGNSAGGIHAAALGGLWQAAVFGFAGLTLSDRGPEVDPHLPAGWRGMSFRIRWRGREHELKIPGTSSSEEATR